MQDRLRKSELRGGGSFLFADGFFASSRMDGFVSEREGRVGQHNCKIMVGRRRGEIKNQPEQSKHGGACGPKPELQFQLGGAGGIGAPGRVSWLLADGKRTKISKLINGQVVQVSDSLLVRGLSVCAEGWLAGSESSRVGRHWSVSLSRTWPAQMRKQSRLSA